jgi:hypothetical protein
MTKTAITPSLVGGSGGAQLPDPKKNTYLSTSIHATRGEAEKAAANVKEGTATIKASQVYPGHFVLYVTSPNLAIT